MAETPSTPVAGDPVLVGIDVGGTTVKVAVVSQEGCVLDRRAIPTSAMESPEELDEAAHTIRGIVLDIARDPALVQAVGLAVPGVVSPAGELLMAPNVDVDLPGLMEALGGAFGVPVFPVNDANAAALGELWRGSGQGASDLVFITLGTGVGGGIVVGGDVVVGRGGAGEIGHLPVVEGGRPCGCGNHGCLEMYTSSRGLVITYRQLCDEAGQEGVTLDHDAHALPIFEAARAGDAVALRAVAIYGETLGRALATLACVLDPEVLVIGGGMSAALDLFGPHLQRAFEATAIPTCRAIPIREATLGNLAGMVGAAYHARRSLGARV